MAKNKRKSSVAAKFHVGDKVRVKHGVNDVEYPDIPLGGWAGTITEAHKDRMYTIRWSDETLAAINPVVKKRSEKDGTVLAEYWLGDDDLEIDPGGPLDIEQPTEITTKPLAPEDQDDRIRAIFGLTSNDPLPYVCDETLLSYYKHLAENLRFPFKVDYFVETGRFERRRKSVTVLGLLDPATDPPDETEGLICKARLGSDVIEMPLAEFEVDEDASGLQVLADYCYWFWNSGAEPDGDEAWTNGGSTKDHHGSVPPRQPSAVGASVEAVVKCGLLGAFHGVVVGAALRAITGADWGAWIGGSVLGVLGAILGMRYGLFFGALNRIVSGPLFGGIVGVLTGAVLGVFAGVAVTAWMGAIPGAVIGSLVVRFLPQRRVRPLSTLFWTVAGAGIGTCILAFRRDYDGAAEGMIYGGTIGAAAGVTLFLALVLSLNLLPSERNR